jgi:DNA-binding NarL/FixJ family response regulator
MAQEGNFIRRVLTVRQPSPGGRCKSMIVTSGAQTANSRNTAAASIASQTISMSVCLLNVIRKPSSIIGWSAAIMTLILPGTQALSGRNYCSHYQARRGILDARKSEFASYQAKTEFTLSSEAADPREDVDSRDVCPVRENSMSPSGQCIRVLIADDHPLMRDGLRSMLQPVSGLKVVAEAADGAECLAKFREHRPDVAIVDLQMPKIDGLQVIGALCNEYDDARCIVLTSFAGDARVSRALNVGASSYLLKTSRRDDIIRALFDVARGRRYLDSDVAQDIATHRGTELLSAKEVSVLRLIAAGKRNRVIGEELSVSEDTIKTRIKNILAKLEADDRTHAVSIAVSRGFIDQ